MRNKENIQALLELNPDYIGFIFYKKSRRYVGDDFDPAITSLIPLNICRVGVFVDSDITEVKNKIEKYRLDYVQLHGSEPVEYCTEIGKAGVKIIKAFGIHRKFNFRRIDEYNACCHYYMFDKKTELYGGSGKKFDWEILNRYDGSKPYFLSGGINADDVKSLSVIWDQRVHALDLNSRFEIYPGYKDIDQIKTFIKIIRQKNNEIQCK